MEMTKKERDLIEEMSSDLYEVYELRKKQILTIITDAEESRPGNLRSHYEKSAKDKSYVMMQGWHRWEKARGLIYDWDRDHEENKND
mgnify:CR=1 FL=1|jgi:hypothetical protein